MTPTARPATPLDLRLGRSRLTVHEHAAGDPIPAFSVTTLSVAPALAELAVHEGAAAWLPAAFLRASLGSSPAVACRDTGSSVELELRGEFGAITATIHGLSLAALAEAVRAAALAEARRG